MGKKSKLKAAENGVQSQENTVPTKTDLAKMTPYEREEFYVKTLSPEDKKQYYRTKRAIKYSEWLSEYWVILVLGIMAFVVTAVVSIIVTFRLWEPKLDTDETNTPVINNDEESAESADYPVDYNY